MFFLIPLLTETYPVYRASFSLVLDQGVEKKALPELNQKFEVGAAQTSGLVNLVLSRQTVFLRVHASVYC